MQSTIASYKETEKKKLEAREQLFLMKKQEAIQESPRLLKQRMELHRKEMVHIYFVLTLSTVTKL